MCVCICVHVIIIGNIYPYGRVVNTDKNEWRLDFDRVHVVIKMVFKAEKMGMSGKYSRHKETSPKKSIQNKVYEINVQNSYIYARQACDNVIYSTELY